MFSWQENNIEKRINARMDGVDAKIDTKIQDEIRYRKNEKVALDHSIHVIFDEIAIINSKLDLLIKVYTGKDSPRN